MSRRRRFDPDWSGSDEWIADARAELLSRPGRAEVLAISYLRRLGVLLRRQEVVGRRYFVTLVLPDSGVALEFTRSGRTRSAYNAERDRHRDEAIRRAGWRLVRVGEEEVVADPGVVVLRIGDGTPRRVP
jgi:very-short-patch-repair endonuclease